MRPRNGLLPVIGMLGVIIVGGCGGDIGVPEVAVVSDSAGIRMVEAGAPSNVPPRIGISDEPVYRVGTDHQEHAFGVVQTNRAEGLGLLYLHGVDAESGELMLGMPLAMVRGRRHETPFLAVPHVRFDRTTGVVDTVAMADWDQSIATGGGNNPFQSGGFSTLSAGEFVVGRGDRAELRWIDRAGAVRQIVRRARAFRRHTS